MEQQRNIYVAGNYIAEQHIETQILHADNVYNHAPQQFRTHLPLTDVEDVMPSAKSTTARPSKRPNAHHFLETRTFIYRYNNARPEDSRRLPLLSSSSPKNITILNPISNPKRSRTISTHSLTENYPTPSSHGPALNRTCTISSSGSKNAIWSRYRKAWPSGQSPKTTSPTDAVITLRTCVISITPKHHYPLSNGSLISSILLLLIPPNWMNYAAKSAGHSAVNKKNKYFSYSSECAE